MLVKLGLDIMLDAVVDCLRLLPFLFVTYLCMEFLEDKGGEKIQNIISKTDKSGPVWGALLGLLPQCGFSAAASSLYAGRIISVGTLLAIYMSTSDEMLPILISSKVPFKTVGVILFSKFIIAMITGMVVSLVLRFLKKQEEPHNDIHTVCEHEHCSCKKGPFYSAVMHTVKITIYIFVLSVIVNLIVEIVGEAAMKEVLTKLPLVTVFVSALVGLLPNCAASVIITELYVEGILSAGSMMAGLLASAGVGLLILFKLLNSKKEAAYIVGLLFVSGVFWGLLIDFSGLGALFG